MREAARGGHALFHTELQVRVYQLLALISFLLSPCPTGTCPTPPHQRVQLLGLDFPLHEEPPPVHRLYIGTAPHHHVPLNQVLEDGHEILRHALRRQVPQLPVELSNECLSFECFLLDCGLVILRLPLPSAGQPRLDSLLQGSDGALLTGRPLSVLGLGGRLGGRGMNFGLGVHCQPGLLLGLEHCLLGWHLFKFPYYPYYTHSPCNKMQSLKSLPALNQSEEQSKLKFISLMHSLITEINSNPSHQLLIYSCLNTSEIRRLFESLHDHSRELRLTAMMFVVKLLFGCTEIVETLLMRDGCDGGVGRGNKGARKYLVTGLARYGLGATAMCQLMGAIAGVRYRRGVLFWHVDIKTRQVGYVMAGEEEQDQAEVDPLTHLIGIFVGEGESRQEARTMHGASSASSARMRHTDLPRSATSISISNNCSMKPGQFSIPRKY